MIEALAHLVLALSASIALSILAKGTLVVALALVAVRCARRAKASMRHLMLASAFAVLLALPLALLVPPITVHISHREAVGAAAEFPFAADETSRPGLTSGGQAGAAPAHWTSRSAWTALGVAWTIGTLLFLVPVAITPWRLRQLRRTARPWPRGSALVGTLACGAGVCRPVALLVHEAVTSPMTCGLAHPAIVLPADAPRWTEAEIRRALVHELEHIRRADWPVHVATRLVCALYWFHPLVWTAWRRLGLESERACDDSVLRGAERTAYAEQLVMLARRLTKRPALPALSMADRSDLSARIAAVLDDTQVRGRLGMARASAIVAVAGIVVAAVAPLRAVAPLAGPQSAAKPAENRPAFEVASVKKNTSNADGQSMRMQPGGRLVVTNQLLRPLVLLAYGLQPQQLAGGPDWIDSDRFDIVAQAGRDIPPSPPGGPPGVAQLMMQRLLEERFKLTVHTEARELPIYALTLARSDGRLGPRLRPSTHDCEARMTAFGRGQGPLPPRSECGISGGGQGRVVAGGTSLTMLANLVLSGPAGRIVVDRTGLTGAFDFELDFAPDPLGSTGARVSPDAPPPATDDRPSLFTALEEQLGLTLQPQRAPVDVLVIDRLEPPTEN